MACFHTDCPDDTFALVDIENWHLMSLTVSRIAVVLMPMLLVSFVTL